MPAGQQRQQEDVVKRQGSSKRGKLNLDADSGPSVKKMVPTAQAVARRFQPTFGCTRLQELGYFCMLQSTLQFQGTCSVDHFVSTPLFYSEKVRLQLEAAAF